MKQAHLTTMRLMAVLLLGALVLLAPIPLAHAAPQAPQACAPLAVPEYFSGSIQIPVNPPNVGDTLLATLNDGSGSFVGQVYHDTGDLTLKYAVMVPPDSCNTTPKDGGVEGDALTFSINGRTVATTEWHSGLIETLDINLVVDHIVISPKTPSIDVGETQAFTTEAFAAQGWTMGDATSASTFSIVQAAAAGGSWSGNVYTSQNWGDWTVTAACQGKTDTAALHVISPNVPPVHPSSFYGLVQTSDATVVVGTPIQILVPGVTDPVIATVQSDGNGGLGYQIDVPGDDLSTADVKEGGVQNDVLTFQVNGSVYATSIWQGGINTRLDLHPPKAVLSAPASALEGGTVTLDATDSPDAGHDIATYTFDCGGGVLSAGSTSTAQCTFAQQGDYTARVTVVDAQHASSSATQVIHVTNVTPVVNLGTPTDNTINVGDTFTRNGSFTDPGADSWTVTVDYGDGTSGPLTLTGKNFTVSHRYTQPGDYTLTVMVNDGSTSGSATLTVHVLGPSADAGGPYTGMAGVPVLLTGASTCPTGHICNVEWWANGTLIGSAAGINHTWNTAGDYTVEFRVIDTTGGATASDTAAVHINAASATVHLLHGWNLVSFNIVPANATVDAVLTSIQSKYDLVYAWDGVNQKWLKADNVPTSPDELTTLHESMGFWVEITDAAGADLTVAGSIPGATPISLHNAGNGWNLVGFPSSHDKTLAPTGVITGLKLVYAYHPQTHPDPWVIYDPTALPFANTLTALTQNWGYWVQVTADSTWTVNQ
jgi:hypothetical protein